MQFLRFQGVHYRCLCGLLQKPNSDGFLFIELVFSPGGFRRVGPDILEGVATLRPALPAHGRGLACHAVYVLW